MQSCTRVHEDDEHKFKKVVWAGHVSKKRSIGLAQGNEGKGGDRRGRDGDPPPNVKAFASTA